MVAVFAASAARIRRSMLPPQILARSSSEYPASSNVAVTFGRSTVRPPRAPRRRHGEHGGWVRGRRTQRLHHQVIRLREQSILLELRPQRVDLCHLLLQLVHVPFPRAVLVLDHPFAPQEGDHSVRAIEQRDKIDKRMGFVERQAHTSVVVDQPVEAGGQAGEFNGRGGHVVSTRVPAPGASCSEERADGRGQMPEIRDQFDPEQTRRLQGQGSRFRLPVSVFRPGP